MHEQHCEMCGKTFLARTSGGHPQRFCSRPCRHRAAAALQQMRYTAKRSARRQAAVRAAEEGTAGTICPGCGAMFAPLRSTGRYCSPKCWMRIFRRRHPRIHERHCETCGTAFMARLGGQPQRFCSLSCRRSAKNARRQERRRQPQPRPQTSCPVCGTMFTPIRRALYCSSKCKQRAYDQRRWRANQQAQGTEGAANDT
jgi:predicted nucleic acid-binding Zn ribbon protein